MYTNFFPEFFISSSILVLLIYGSCIGYSPKYNYPILNCRSICNLILIWALLLVSPSTHSIFTHYFYSDHLTSFSKVFIILAVLGCFALENKVEVFEYFILCLLSLIGLCFIVSSTDLISVYLSLELQTLSFYVLTLFLRTSVFSVEAGLKYFISGAAASALLILGISIMYGFSGSTNFFVFRILFENPIIDESWEAFVNSGGIQADKLTYQIYQILENTQINVKNLEVIVAADHNASFQGLSDSIFNWDKAYMIMPDINYFIFGFYCVISALFFKLGLAPFHQWVPDIYEGSKTNVTVLFSVVPKLAVFVVLFRLISVFGDPTQLIYLKIVGLLSLYLGSFGAYGQHRSKRLLAYSGIAHTGYALIALSCGTYSGINSAIFYTCIYMLTSLFLWGGLLAFLKNQERTIYITDLVSWFNLHFGLAILSFLVLFSLAGIPPFAGFWSKLSVFICLASIKSYVLVVLAGLVAGLGFIYYLALILVLFEEEVKSPSQITSVSINKTKAFCISLSALILLFFNFFESFFIKIFMLITICI